MPLLERIWELIALFFSALLRGFERGVTSLFGSANQRALNRFRQIEDEVLVLESHYEPMSNEELKQQTDVFRDRLKTGETLNDIMFEAFAVCREAGKRYLNMRHYDCQITGGAVLHEGSIAEMITGEGKTLVATLPAYLNALSRQGVHVITVNDYLARRDMEWMAPLYMGLGLTVGAIQSDMDVHKRQAAYACDITYGTNNEFGFDYLRDNMRPAAQGDDRYPKYQQQSQGKLNFAIIDEVDNILVDEARTPLIISGPAHDNIRKYADADRIARQLKKEEHFLVNEKDHSANLTDEGVRAAERLAGVESFYTAGNMEWPHLLDNSLKAHYLYKNDVNYVVKEGRVIIVDEFTGRLMEGRQWSDGLHQAVEAKEGVKIKEETQTLATITLQNFFKLYKKIAGMTGTAMTEANEFLKIYGLNVVAIEPNRTLHRTEHPDVIYQSEREKYVAVADDIEQVYKWDIITLKNGNEVFGEISKQNSDSVYLVPHESKQTEVIPRAEIASIAERGRPVLVGTVSIEKSERIARLLEQRGIPHEVLNAKHHEREAEIVSQAGRLGAVTIATNMAGRGTDIVLGGNPETMAWARLQDRYETRLDVPHEEWTSLLSEIEEAENMVADGEQVKKIGGLYVIGTERHDARRIDLQLRGRCGRQGDPGDSRFFLSLEDDLMRIFAGPWVKGLLARLGMKEGERIESKLVTRRIEGAQKKVEERNFEIRKNLLEYDEVMDEQRKRIYSYRQQILDGTNCRNLILDSIRNQVVHYLNIFLHRHYSSESFADWASTRLATPFEARDFQGLTFKDAELFVRDHAERMVETQVLDTVEENLPADQEEEWNWEALTKIVNQRWNLNYRDRDLKRFGRNNLSSELIEEARLTVSKIELADGELLLDEDYAFTTAIAWAKHKFGVTLELHEIRDTDPDELKELVYRRAEAIYGDKESEYPIMAGLYRFSQGEQGRIDRDGLISWARDRFEVELTVDDLKNKQRDEVRELLVQYSNQHQEKSRVVLQEMQQQLSGYLDAVHGHSATTTRSGGNGALKPLSQWLQDNLSYQLDAEEIARLDQEQLSNKLTAVFEDRYRPEMQRMERTLLLEIVDTAWKDHLLVMDHLRSSVGLKGYAQMDPKVEYKREGMKLFDQMWQSIEERTTDLVFRMEQLDEDFVGSTWNESAASHAEAQSSSEMAQQQEAAIDSSGEQGGRLDPIRNRNERVGRNDICPYCDSGKKYKNCCLRKKNT